MGLRCCATRPIAPVVIEKWYQPLGAPASRRLAALRRTVPTQPARRQRSQETIADYGQVQE